MNRNKQATWETYVTSWQARSPEEKHALFESCLAPNCVYTDPLTQTRGWDELIAYMQEFQRQVPGGHFKTDQFIAHHGRSIARWSMLNGEAVAIGQGISYAEYDAADRLVAMTGFWETPEALA